MPKESSIGRVAVELLEHGVRVEAVLQLDDQAQAVLAVREVHDVADAGQLLAVDGVLDLLDHLFRAHHVRQFGDHQAGAAGGELLDLHLGAGLERAAAGGVGVADAVQAHDPAARGQVRAGDEPHEVLERGVRVRDQVPGRGDDLHQVVRGHVGGHADGDAGGAVDQQVGERGRQHVRLGQLVVVVGDEVHDVLVEVVRQRQGRRRQAGLGVPRGCRAVVERAEVAVAVDQRQPQREVLRHAHHGVVDRGIAVRVQLAHDLAHHAGALDVAAVRAQAHLAHHVQDAPLHRLQAVAGVREGPRIDDRIGVLEERAFHLGRDVDINDVLDEILDGFPCRGGTLAAGHGAGGSF